MVNYSEVVRSNEESRFIKTKAIVEFRAISKNLSVIDMN